MGSTVADNGPITVIKPSGPHLDASNVTELKKQADELFEQSHFKIVLDLTDVEFIDSSGLTQIIMINRRLGQEESGRMTLAGMKTVVASLVRLARLDTVIETFEKPEQAVESMKLD